MSRIAKGREARWELGDVLSRFDLGFSDQPPFVPGWMFGPTDLPWLTELRDHLVQTHAKVTRDLPPADWEARDRLLADLLPRYREFLVTLARARLDTDPELRAFLADSRLLKDIPQDSDQHRWLKGMLNQVAPAFLWTGQEWARVRAFPSDYLAATDLPLLVRLGKSGLAAIRHTEPGTTADEIAQLVRPQAEAFYFGLVKQRLPE